MLRTGLIRRRFAPAILGGAAALALMRAGLAQTDDPAALDRNASKLYQACNATEAIALAERSLIIREKTLPADHPDLALSLNNLAFLYSLPFVYHDKGSDEDRRAKAAQLYQRALAILQKAHPAEHADIATILTNLAVLYWWDKDRFTETERLLKRALAIREKVLSPGHPDIATSIDQLGFYYQGPGNRLTEAETLLKRALAMREKALPAGHPDIAVTLNSLGLLNQVQGRYAEAERLFKRALAILENAHPPEHLDIYTSVTNLVMLYVECQGRLAEAKPLMMRTRRFEERIMQAARHPDPATSRRNACLLERAHSRITEAEPSYRRARPMGIANGFILYAGGLCGGARR